VVIDLFFGRQRSAAEPPPSDALLALIKTMEDRSYRTYKARVRSVQRLNQRNNAWNFALISLATSLTISSVGLLVNESMYGSGGPALMVVLAVLSLVASLIVSNMNYGARSRAMESNYKRIQQISLDLEGLPTHPFPGMVDRFNELKREYRIAVESSENHSESDHMRAIRDPQTGTVRDTQTGAVRNPKAALWRDQLVTLAPYGTLIIPLAIIVPFIAWFINGL